MTSDIEEQSFLLFLDFGRPLSLAFASMISISRFFLLLYHGCFSAFMYEFLVFFVARLLILRIAVVSFAENGHFSALVKDALMNFGSYNHKKTAFS